MFFCNFNKSFFINYLCNNNPTQPNKLQKKKKKGSEE